MQTASHRVWTQVAMSISYNDNHYTTSTYKINQVNTKKKELKTYVSSLISKNLKKTRASVWFGLKVLWKSIDKTKQ